MSESLVLCWKNLSLYVDVSDKKRIWSRPKVRRVKLLSNVSGVLRAGHLCAIMGPSGAGKTTLLGAISQRFTGGVQGEIHLNGRPVDTKLMVKLSGFVPQNDLTIKTLTVIEHLNFMARLKMDRRVSKAQVKRIIDALREELNLNTCALTQLNKISGGESKRVSLAVQPTTGLDSYSASSVISLLRDQSRKGKAVICSVHQPASGIFEMFDTVSLLVPGGRQAYFGDGFHVKEYFRGMGLECPAEYNIAEFIVEQLNVSSDQLSHAFETDEVSKKLDQEINCVKKDSSDFQLVYGTRVSNQSLSSLYICIQMRVYIRSYQKETKLFGNISHYREWSFVNIQGRNSKIDEQFLKYYSVKPASQITQLRCLMRRTALDLFRNYQKIIFKLLIYAITAFLISIVFIGSTLDQIGIQNIQGLNYSVITEVVFSQSQAVLNTFPPEIPIFLRETNNGVYKPGPFYLAKVLVWTLRVIFEATMFTLVVYTIAGRNEASMGFLKFLCPVIACALASSSFGFCMSAMFDNPRTSNLFIVPFDFVSYTFSGLFLQLSTLPVYLAWLKYVSRFYYGVEAVSILQWKDIANIPCSENPSLPCVATGQAVLFNYGYQPSNLFFDFAALLTITLLMHALGYYCLRRKSNRQAVY